MVFVAEVARALAWADVVGCRCVDGEPCQWLEPDGTLCAPGGEWSACPGRLLASALACHLRWVWDAAQVAPLADWPRGYSVEVIQGMRDLTGIVHERARSEGK
ncbi:MAG: hypothetical protein AMXMBFR64_05100 [Myxococcales bacterium]